MPSNVSDLLRDTARRVPDRVALVEASTGRRTTWAELDRVVDQTASGLAAIGLVAGYRVALVLGNRTEFVVAYLAALRARLVVVPVNPGAAVGEVTRVLDDSGARLVVAESRTADLVRRGAAEAAQPPRLVFVDGDLQAGERDFASLAGPPGPELPVMDAEALAVLLYTSGTSGRPRGAMLTHRALLANVRQAAAVDPPMVSGDDVVLGVLPMFHVYGLNAVLGQVLIRGAALVLVDGFDPEATLDIIEDEAVSVVPVAPPVFAYWLPVDGLRDRLSSVRLLLSGSAPLAPDLLSQFEAVSGVEVHQGYGLTEGAPAVTSTLCSATHKPGSVGAALPGVDLRFVDESGREPGPDDVGEIHFRGDNLFSGYWPDGVDGPDADGWWPTGDVGYLDSDGDLFLVDRLKELVIVSGFNVYPSEVEDVLREVEGVAEAAVIGVPHDLSGEAVVAYLLPKDPAIDAARLETAARDHCASRLARFKQPAEINVVDQLPHTATGKVAKGRLRAARRRQALGLLE